MSDKPIKILFAASYDNEAVLFVGKKELKLKGVSGYDATKTSYVYQNGNQVRGDRHEQD